MEKYIYFNVKMNKNLKKFMPQKASYKKCIQSPQSKSLEQEKNRDQFKDTLLDIKQHPSKPFTLHFSFLKRQSGINIKHLSTRTRYG